MSTRRRTSIQRFGFVALLLAASLLLTACFGGGSKEQSNVQSSAPAPASQPTAGGTTNQAPAERSVVTMAMTSAWQGLQPYNVVGLYSTVIFDQIYDRLTYLTADMEYKPRLATHWEMADDFRSITFYLDENAKWHDGVPVTADDVVFTIEVMTNPETKATNRGAFLYIAGTNAAGIAEDGAALGVERVDSHTVRIAFKEPMEEGAFLNGFARAFFVFPKHLLGDVPPAELDRDPFWRQPVGSGPFKFSRLVEGQFVELVRNEDYHLGSPSFETLVIRVVPQTTIAAGLQTGDIDVLVGFGMGDVPLEDWEMVKNMSHIEAESVTSLTTQFMTVNTEKPYLSDPAVRRALWLATNRQALVDNLYRGEGTVARGPYPAMHPYFAPDLPEIPYDPDAARALLEQAGWDFDRELVLTVPTGNALRERTGALIQQDLRRIGLKVQIQQLDFTTALTRIREGDYDLALFGAGGAPDPDLTGLMHPSGANNLSRHRIPEIVNAIEEGLRGLTFDERKVHYYELQEKIQEHAPYVYLYHENSRLARNKRLTNVPIGDFMWHNFGTWQWVVQ